jgi:hypothetical protein
MSTPLFTSPEPSGPSRPSSRPRLGPSGLLSRRRAVPDTDGVSPRPARQAEPGGPAPALPGSPLPSALLPLPPGFELNRGPVASVVPA